MPSEHKLIKCCQGPEHSPACAEFWFKKYREDVRARVEVEKELNAQIIRNEVNVAKEREISMDGRHEWALEMDAERTKADELPDWPCD